MKLFLCFLLALVVMSGWVMPVEAIEDPRSRANNKVGIHITDISDVEPAAELVNSNGGEWGYVTLVIREDNRDLKEWQDFFNLLREKKLIPIVRLATYAEGASWAKPTVEDVDGWVEFLNSLNWVTKNRYVVLFNEPNHAKEWGGQIRPDEYVEIVNAFHPALKEASEHYFVLPAGMDDAASDTGFTMNAGRYLQQMYQADNAVFGKFDGWTSHSYPNPHFSGTPTETGPGTVRGFEAELRLVKQFGFDETKPVFITETGWVHSEGVDENENYYSPEEVAEFMAYSYEQVWNGDNVVAVTPFILNYPTAPFDHFSWKRSGSNEYLAPYHTVKELEKVAGSPTQDHEFVYGQQYLPERLADDGSYRFVVELENTGQSIWKDGNVKLTAATDLVGVSFLVRDVPETKPGEVAEIWVEMSIDAGVEGELVIQMSMMAGNDVVGDVVQETVSVEQNAGLVTRFQIWLQSVRHPEQFLVALMAPGLVRKRRDET